MASQAQKKHPEAMQSGSWAGGGVCGAHRAALRVPLPFLVQPAVAPPTQLLEAGDRAVDDDGEYAAAKHAPQTTTVSTTATTA
eukprot:COSAG06_NODE_37950_length_429_cov_0.815152_2_plen_82_part_01